LKRLVEAVARDVEAAQDLAGLALLLLVGDREEEMLRRDVVVLEAVGLGLGGLPDALEARGDAEFGGAGGGGEPVDRRLELEEGGRLDAELRENGRRDAAFLADERVQHVLGLELRVTALFGQPLSRDQRLLRLLGKSVHVERHAALLRGFHSSGLLRATGAQGND